MTQSILELQARIAALESALETTRAEVRGVDDLADGIMAALLHLVPLLLKRHPEVARPVLASWARNELEHQRALRGERTEMPLQWYEAQAALSRVCTLAGLPPSDEHDAP